MPALPSPHNTGRWPGHSIEDLLDGPQADWHLQHRGAKGLHHAAAVAIRPGEFPQEGTEARTIPARILGRHLGFTPAAAVWTPTLVQHPVRHVHRDRWQLNDLMRMVRCGQGKRRGPHAHCSGRSSWTVVGGKSTWRWPGWPGFPPALRGVVDDASRRGFLKGASDEGGLDEVVEFCVSRASRVSTRLCSCATSSRRVRTYACTASGVCAQSWGVKGNDQTVLVGSDSGVMTSPARLPQG